MKRDNNDDAFTQLYQQRVQSVITPKIDSKDLLNKQNTSHYKQQKSSIKKWKFTSIIGATFIASFSIFALINQLQKPDSVSPNKTSIIVHRDIMIDKNEAPATEKVITIHQPLPASPNRKERPKTLAQPSISPPSTIEITPVIPQVTINDEQTFPTIKLPEYSLAVIKKVLPKYPLKAKQQRLSGTVKLSYLVNNKGAVTDVIVIHSTNSTIFNKSAIKALQQWQYDVNSLKIVAEAPIKHEIQFDFSLNKQ